MLALFQPTARLLALLTTTLFSAAVFALFAYVAPIREQITHLSAHGVTWTLFLIGVGLTLGNYFGGRFADRSVGNTLKGAFVGMAMMGVALFWTSTGLIAAEISLFLWAMFSFACVPALQINVMAFGKAHRSGLFASRYARRTGSLGGTSLSSTGCRTCAVRLDTSDVNGGVG